MRYNLLVANIRPIMAQQRLAPTLRAYWEIGGHALRLVVDPEKFGGVTIPTLAADSGIPLDLILASIQMFLAIPLAEIQRADKLDIPYGAMRELLRIADPHARIEYMERIARGEMSLEELLEAIKRQEAKPR